MATKTKTEPKAATKKDVFGSAPDSRRGLMNAVLVKAGAKGVTAADFDGTGATRNHAYAHLKFLEARGFATKGDDGRWYVAGAKPKKARTKKAATK